MKYICLGYIEPGKFEGMTEDERHATFDECFEYNDHLRANGHLVAEVPLQPPETALTLYWKNGKVATNCNVFLLRVVVFAPRKHRALAFVSESKMLRIPFAHLITISGFEEDTADSKDAPALLHFDRRLRLFRLRRLHFLSSF